MSGNAAMPVDTMPAPISGDEYTPEEMGILNGEAPVTPAPAPMPDNTAPEADNDATDADLDEIETEDPDQPRDEKGRFVPKSAYLRVKEEAKGTNMKLASVAAELIRMREREAMMREAIQSATRPAEESQPDREIAPEEDIFGAYKQMQAKLQRLEQELGQRDQQTRSEIQNMQLQAAVRVDLEGFATKNPDFMDAYQFVVSQRDRELTVLGLSDPAQRQQMIKQEARQIMETALRSGRSAGQAIWELSQARGYQPKPKDAPTINPEAAETIERINKGKAASASLRGTGTTADVGQALTLSKIADMDESTYFRTRDQYVAKHGVGAWKKLTGGM